MKKESQHSQIAIHAFNTQLLCSLHLCKCLCLLNR
jgi:hypothetical protein